MTDIVQWSGLKMNDKVANVQRKALKELHKAWRTIAQDYFKNIWLLESKF